MTEIFPSILVFPAQLTPNRPIHLAIVGAIHNGTTTGRVGQDSVDDIAIRYGLDGPGIESLWGILRTRPYRPWRPPSLLYNGCRVFPEGKESEAWR
jgi:hypothetical protein